MGVAIAVVLVCMADTCLLAFTMDLVAVCSCDKPFLESMDEVCVVEMDEAIWLLVIAMDVCRRLLENTENMDEDCVVDIDDLIWLLVNAMDLVVMAVSVPLSLLEIIENVEVSNVPVVCEGVVDVVKSLLIILALLADVVNILVYIGGISVNSDVTVSDVIESWAVLKSIKYQKIVGKERLNNY